MHTETLFLASLALALVSSLHALDRHGRREPGYHSCYGFDSCTASLELREMLNEEYLVLPVEGRSEPTTTLGEIWRKLRKFKAMTP